MITEEQWQQDAAERRAAGRPHTHYNKAYAARDGQIWRETHRYRDGDGLRIRLTTIVTDDAIGGGRRCIWRKCGLDGVLGADALPTRRHLLADAGGG